ncbi:ribonuclease HI [Flexibacter flexilis DSM 6793]|uniref:ribonuclease H n=1 Tax=Flexibacter flexilis DSM 6793 TaxID=927664 RepID=A0A1I1NHK1_9BACT|nr:ribonuclease HI [Flexibacter flexilis]SFC94223.1 ribonuclease HI [Flexibacter flexilis DSM 6793]
METEEIIPEVNIYADGGAEPNPGKGGFGVIMTYKEHKKEFSQGYLLTTNNRMELMGVIFALERLKKPSIVNVYTDSQYVVNGIEKGWAEKWKSNNWYRKRNAKAINYDLWDKLLNLISNNQKVTFNWVKGHAGHKENERCDELANWALNSKNLLEDVGYESEKEEVYIPTHSEQEKHQNRKRKVLNEGDNCRKCNTQVIKKDTKRKELKPNQEYYFDYYLLCPTCKTMYMVEEAKKFVNDNKSRLFT